jgi:hypothetical protein
MKKNYDKDKIKNSLSIEQVFDLVSELGGEPTMYNNYFVSETICHNHPGDGSHKLYYYDNTKLFRCYTECQDTFDIFELVCKVKNIAQEYKIRYDETGKEILVQWNLYDAIQFVAMYYGFEAENENFFEKRIELHDWEILNKYEANNLEKQRQIIDLHIYEDGEKILNNLPRPRLKDWEDEGISPEVTAAANICYDPHANGIIIPHYNIDDQLIGIRIRTLIKEQEQYGKYKPAILNGKMYNHPLGFNLYNINNSKRHIQEFGRCFVFESEKSCLKYASYFGLNNDISVAICGNALNNYQVSLLLSLGCKEMIIGLDKQYEQIGNKEWERWTQKFYQIANKYAKYIQVSFLFDLEDNLLDYKDSPIDKGKDVFFELYNKRIRLAK